MSREPRIPTYRRHKQSGQAIVTLTDGLGGRRDVLLGKYRSAASRAEYARVIAEWELEPPAPRPPSRPGRPRKAPDEVEQPDQQRKRRGKGPGATGPVVSTPATEQPAVPPTGAQETEELPPAQHKLKERRARKPRG